MEYRCFYEENPRPMPSPVRSFGWDFFDPFDAVRVTEEASVMVGLHRSSEEDLRVVREEEGIPELEEEGSQGECLAVKNERGKLASLGAEEQNDNGGKIAETSEKGLTLLETSGTERELLDALRDVVDHFIRAYDSGKEVSRMLEANTLDPNAGVEEKKGEIFYLSSPPFAHLPPFSRAILSCLLLRSGRGREKISLFDGPLMAVFLQRTRSWSKR